jgi:hypothetical protein
MPEARFVNPFSATGDFTMIAMFRRPVAIAAFFLVGLLGTRAHADITVTVSESGTTYYSSTVMGSPSTPGGLAVATTSVVTPDYSITILGGAEKQTATQSDTTSATVTITALTNAPEALVITITGTGFTYPPVGNAMGQSNIGGTTYSASSGMTLSMLSTVLGMPFTPQSPSVNATGSWNNTQNVSGSIPATPFSMTEAINVDLPVAGDSLNYSSSTTLQAVVPEPSSLAFAALGVVSGIGYGLQRRRRAQSI